MLSQVASRKSQVASRKSQVASRKSQVASRKSQVASRTSNLNPHGYGAKSRNLYYGTMRRPSCLGAFQGRVARATVCRCISRTAR
jgi:hypothetical protein